MEATAQELGRHHHQHNADNTSQYVHRVLVSLVLVALPFCTTPASVGVITNRPLARTTGRALRSTLGWDLPAPHVGDRRDAGEHGTLGPEAKDLHVRHPQRRLVARLCRHRPGQPEATT